MDRKAIRRLARQRMEENWLCALVSLVVYGVLVALVPVVQIFFVGPLSLGLSAVYLRLSDGEKPSMGMLFSGFSRFGQAFLLWIIKYVLIMLWSLLLYIPGILKAYSYSMAYYIMAESPEIKAAEALKESKKRMAGHRMELFLLQLSFIGWWLLCVVTCGLAVLYVAPYYNTAVAIFYRNLPRQADETAERVSWQQQSDFTKEPICATQTSFYVGMAGDTQVLTPSQQIGNGVFQGVSGSLKEQCYGLPDGDVFAVGRDSQQCGILVESGNMSVSRCHCTIQYVSAEGAYFVTDLSVNGSYVGDMRLPKGEPARIEPGTIVSLGDGRESFRLN